MKLKELIDELQKIDRIGYPDMEVKVFANGRTYTIYDVSIVDAEDGRYVIL